MIKYIFLLMVLIISCSEIDQPKPRAELSLNYPRPEYKKSDTEIQFNYEYNSFAKIIKAPKGQNLFYPELKATLYLSHSTIKNNLDSLLNDAYKLPSKHLRKAQEIPERVFINQEKKVYGTMFNVVGDAASQIQFFLTDSSYNFLIGSLYFYVKPNYDSILPAVKYIERDIIKLIETLEWNYKAHNKL
ncbi:MAG: gliding motility lipoprotein GldD [Flavobacteriaceae bacterium]|nr:gliding motility lipoprotein GldD [Flavobacteriaceae bacterium]